MTRSPPSTARRRVPYSGLWLDGFSLTAVAGGALLAGGQGWQRDGIGATPRASTGAAFWDTSREEWLELSPLPEPRQDHAAVALPDGRVLLIGGRDNPTPELDSTRYWEPDTRRFVPGPPLRAARSRPVARVLPDGAVLVLGSDHDNDIERGTRAEVLRPGATAWEPAGQTVRIFHTGPVCVSGERVVIAGGRDNGFGFAIIEGEHLAPPLNLSTELWEPSSRAWRTAPHPLTEARDDAEGVTLSDRRILVVGGWHQGTSLMSAEVFDPRTEQWTATGALGLARSSFTLTALPDGRAAVSGGLRSDTYAEATDVELWNPATGTWSPGMPLAVGRAGHHVVPLGEGAFLVAGTTRVAPDGSLETTSEVWRP
ncbi:kelch repeat-containing protein [Myxococcus sp. CA040A]|uniref:Kelch repeat-containing protein n=1 Tax=Myxococcus sp. CA040A TaxID=2741738 RepID=UPI00157B9939|nr:kelch repeat-containing protein [Myxococcus sp. CA040A]NTX08701.1 kelch-like protein [Myxococcus sp. CA040A]